MTKTARSSVSFQRRAELAATQPAGFWDFVEDSGANYTRWTTVTVDAELNAGEVIIEVRAADCPTDLPAWPFQRLAGSSGVLCLDGLGLQGRYLEVRAALLRPFGAAHSPVLRSLCVAHGTPGTDLQFTNHPKSAIVAPAGMASLSVGERCRPGPNAAAQARIAFRRPAPAVWPDAVSKVRTDPNGP